MLKRGGSRVRSVLARLDHSQVLGATEKIKAQVG